MLCTISSAFLDSLLFWKNQTVIYLNTFTSLPYASRVDPDQAIYLALSDQASNCLSVSLIWDIVAHLKHKLQHLSWRVSDSSFLDCSCSLVLDKVLFLYLIV